jgi:methylthioribose-1-phosphate isomerase
MSSEGLMPEWTAIGKVMIGIGLAITVIGALLVAADRIPGLGNVFSWMGKLPGDLSFKRDNVSFYFPIATSILLSVVLSVVFYILGWFFRR